jgi:hypothetical protein
MLIIRALREGGHGDKNMKLIQTSRYGSELSKRLFEGRVVDSEDVLDEGVEEPSGEMSFERKLGNQQGKVCHILILPHLVRLEVSSPRGTEVYGERKRCSGKSCGL